MYRETEIQLKRATKRETERGVAMAGNKGVNGQDRFTSMGIDFCVTRHLYCKMSIRNLRMPTRYVLMPDNQDI